MNRYSHWYPYASSVSSADSFLCPAASLKQHRGRNRQQQQLSRKKRCQLEQPAEHAVDAMNELDVSFCGRLYRLAGLGSLDDAALCKDLVYALLWFQRVAAASSAAATASGCCCECELDADLNAECLQADTRRYELVVELSGKLKRVRDNLPVERLLRRLSRRRQSTYRLRVRLRRRRRVTFEVDETEDEADGVDRERTTECRSANAQDESGQVIRDWMRRLNLVEPTPVTEEAAEDRSSRRCHRRRRSRQVLEVRLLSTTATLVSSDFRAVGCVGGGGGDSDTGVSSMALSDSDQLQNCCPHRLHRQQQHLAPRLPCFGRKAARSFRLYRTECLTDCDSPDIIYFATLV